MSMKTTSLPAFITPVPVCHQTTSTTEIASLFCQGHWERIVLVNNHRQPLGLVQISKLTSYLMGRPHDWAQPLSMLPITEPIATIPADLSWSEYRSYLLSPKSTGNYAVVNADGELLGLLDYSSLLKYLVSQDLEGRFPAIDLPTAGVPPIYQSPSIRSKTPEQSIIPGFLVELLESIPMPLRLQTSTGEVLRDNLQWRSLVGSIPDRDWIGLSVTKSTSQASYAAQISLAQTADALFSPLCCPVRKENDPANERKLGSWQFVKIPLGNTESLHRELSCLLTPGQDLSHQEICSSVLTWVGARGEQTIAGVGVDIAVEPLWLVLATQIIASQPEPSQMSAQNAEFSQGVKDEFSLSISHELKTPITAILGLSSLLLNDGQNPLTERQAQYASLIRKSGRQLMKIVNNLVDLSRLETGQLELQLESVDIATACDRAYKQVQQSVAEEMPAHSIGKTHFTLEIAPNLREIVADELRLGQMLVNLLSNALKFTDSRAGEIGLKVSQWSNDWIGFTVWDTGVGIRASQQQLIFQKFLKLENPLTESSSSTGLGLVLTKGLAQLHSGEVTFISKEGKGSEFTLLLPATAASAGGTDRLPVLPDRASGSEFPITNNSLALILETNPEVISDLTEQLLELGYKCVVARSDSEALRKARFIQPTVVFLNVTNPLLSGDMVLKQLKAETATRHIPAIALAQESTANLGDIIADDFLSLPSESFQLQKQLDRLISQPASPPEPSDRDLTILCLSPTTLTTPCCSLFNWASNSTPKHRIIEASDLEQAELLTKIWTPDIVLLNDTGLSNPLAFLQELSEQENLASLPLVTMSQSTTQAANQVKGLSVFPCLVPTDSLPAFSTLLQVIQVAAGLC